MQLDLFDQSVSETSTTETRRYGTFTDNMKLPIHRWFRYSAGFSAEWVEATIAKQTATRKPFVLDPFCGSGTTLIAAAKSGVDSVGFEMHPFVAKIAELKTNWSVEVSDFEEAASRVVQQAAEACIDNSESTSPLLLKCYSRDNLSRLEALRSAYILERAGSLTEDIYDLVWLAITCILRECSNVGTAQWQYVLPNKSKSKVSEPISAFRNSVRRIRNDLLYAGATFTGSPRVKKTDARTPDCTNLFDLVITSPPYPNNYDYADATRLEMTFWKDVDSWGDLQSAVRQYLVRSCSQHSAAERLVLGELLEDETVTPIRDELSLVCRELEEIRLGKGGRKSYHTMVAAYFADLAKVWNSLRELTREDATLAFVIGDSAPYGVYVPCDEWLGKLAMSSGFSKFHFEKLRDRNIKWKNRKHRVPLKEGILWVRG